MLHPCVAPTCALAHVQVLHASLSEYIIIFGTAVGYAPPPPSPNPLFAVTPVLLPLRHSPCAACGYARA
jgi:hypothetical protein